MGEPVVFGGRVADAVCAGSPGTAGDAEIEKLVM
jgi:hypothetical protein